MQKKSSKQVFSGEDAIKDFITPGSMGFTPVVELPKSLNPLHKDKVRIFVKLLQFVPLYNIKSLPSYTMLDAVPKEKLKNIKHLVEYSSGNTALSLAAFAGHFGIPNMHAIVTPGVPENKRKLLQLMGINLHISHGPSCPDVNANVGGVHDAVSLGKKEGWHNLHQYVNPANQKASEEFVGKELWEQFNGGLSVFVSSIGTAGTISGAGNFLKKKNTNIKVIGTAIKTGSSIPGPRMESAINLLVFPWQKCVDEVVSINTKDAYMASLDLIRLGVFAGPSTGMQLSALVRKLTEYKKKGKLKDLRNKDGEVVTCFLACDTMFPYVNEYFENLPEKLFPKVKDIK